MKRCAFFLLALASPFLLGMSKKTELTITFHTPASSVDPSKTMFPFDLNGKRMYFKIVPEFSQENIASFHSFPSDTGKGNGLTLQLDFRGKNALELVSRNRKDEYLLAMVNAKPVDFVVMDQPVLDGVVTIWQGVSDDVVKQLAKKYPRMKKGSQPLTMSQDMEMRPTTRKEKEQALEKSREIEREEKSPKAKKKAKEVPSLTLPSAPVSPRLPVEGSDIPVGKPVPASAPATPRVIAPTQAEPAPTKPQS